MTFRPLLLSLVTVLAALPLVGAGESEAATLSLTGSDLSVRLWMGGGFDVPITSQSPDPVSISVSSSGGFVLPPALFTNTTPTGFGAATLIPTALFTGVPIFTSLKLSLSNASQNLTPGGGPGGAFGGAGALQGSAVFRVLGGLALVQIPLSPAGGGGTTVALAAGLVASATGGQWTSGAATITGVEVRSAGGAFTNTVTLAGSDARSAAHAGTIRLVAPMRILSNAIGGIPLFFTQTLRFVPEPGTALLFGAGALLTFAWGVRHRRRERL